jgi:Ca-activated chloride channel family protein
MPTPERASPAKVPFAPTLLTPTIPESGEDAQKALPQILAQLPDFPTLADLGAASYSEFFETEIVFAPLENEKGYIFALTLVPQPGLTLPKVRQHYSFLIDRSNSIQKERLSAVKNAVIAALEELDLDDSFNIIAFDSKIEKLSPGPLPATKASLLAARKFLDQVHLGSFFSTTNLTKPLLLTVPAALAEGEHSAILFSDGESLGKKGAQRELALDWTRYNNGRVSLFAIGVGGDPHLPILDAAAAFNRGKVLVPPTKRGIKRKLLKVIKMIGHPVATNMTATALPRASQTKIVLFSKPQQMPSLYLNEPYVILGTIDKLDNFILFVQGKLKDRWLNIKKNVSFVSAKKGDSTLKAQVALQQAYSLYEKYLYDLNPDHLTEASSLLEPHGLQVAFQ